MAQLVLKLIISDNTAMINMRSYRISILMSSEFFPVGANAMLSEKPEDNPDKEMGRVKAETDN